MFSKYKPNDIIIIHQNPVWRDHSDFSIITFAGEDEGRSEWEQLWTHQTGEYRFTLCCIPFFTYGLALDDEVETDSEYMVARVVNSSGHWMSRVHFDDPQRDGIAIKVLQECDHYGIYYEWYNSNHLALSAPKPDSGLQFSNYLWEQVQKGTLQYESSEFW